MAGAQPNALLAARGRRELRVRLPQGATGVEAADGIVYLQAVELPCPTAAPKQALSAAGTTCAARSQLQAPAACQPAASCGSQRLDTPPLQQQPCERPPRAVKRIRLAHAAPAAPWARCGAPPVMAQAWTLQQAHIAWVPDTAWAPVVPVAPIAATVVHTDPLGLRAWLRKVKSLLSPRSHATLPSCAAY